MWLSINHNLFCFFKERNILHITKINSKHKTFFLTEGLCSLLKYLVAADYISEYKEQYSGSIIAIINILKSRHTLFQPFS